LRHCWAAIRRNTTPIATLSQSTPGSSVAESWPVPRTITTMTLTATRPAIHPSANAEPAVRALGVPRTRTTATMGTGLRATASAEGSRSPMASFSKSPVSQTDWVSARRVP
jgi:hypothetical protein